MFENYKDQIRAREIWSSYLPEVLALGLSRKANEVGETSVNSDQLEARLDLLITNKRHSLKGVSASKKPAVVDYDSGGYASVALRALEDCR